MLVYMGADMPLYAVCFKIKIQPLTTHICFPKFSLFLPSIINQLGKFLPSASLYTMNCVEPKTGFTATPANLLTVFLTNHMFGYARLTVFQVPVYVLACAFTCGVGFMADRLGNRGYFTLCVP